ncbi:MAG TPA: nitroreductase/quinone reductase family protein [Anaerolineales bacterium]|nr:nitroreductase/quinone reductase family protein [Anaerolineales bacterium]
MPPVRRNALVELLWKAHRFIYRLSGGRMGARLMQWRVILLTTTGRKTGEPRQVSLNALLDGKRTVVIASNAGEPQHPQWFLNLRANPSAIVQHGRERFRAISREAEGEERERLWRRIVEVDRSYAEYQRRTTRRIALVILEPGSQ